MSRCGSGPLRAEGIPLHLVPDALAAADLAAAAGLCDPETVAQVREDLESD